MTTPYPVPAATEEPLGSVTRVLALSETTGDGNGYDGSNECTDGSSPADSQELFSGDSLPQLSGRIYGGQVVAQGLLAGAATLATVLPAVLAVPAAPGSACRTRCTPTSSAGASPTSP